MADLARRTSELPIALILASIFTDASFDAMPPNTPWWGVLIARLLTLGLGVGAVLLALKVRA
jgi:hypothetical protein